MSFWRGLGQRDSWSPGDPMTFRRAHGKGDVTAYLRAVGPRTTRQLADEMMRSTHTISGYLTHLLIERQVVRTQITCPIKGRQVNQYKAAP